ncbi:MAG: hypothetical protein GF399_11925 [Candidatus Coatesbacteria bacterium]|nr:hypothetical protein [Candidatus Coatesbacteria bacterium]
MADGNSRGAERLQRLDGFHGPLGTRPTIDEWRTATAGTSSACSGPTASTARWEPAPP